jgi:hypothetical protein|eukprot:COSAG02_NODE_4605_length_5174_cov_18.935961_6_plen_58_part_00
MRSALTSTQVRSSNHIAQAHWFDDIACVGVSGCPLGRDQAEAKARAVFLGTDTPVFV